MDRLPGWPGLPPEAAPPPAPHPVWGLQGGGAEAAGAAGAGGAGNGRDNGAGGGGSSSSANAARKELLRVLLAAGERR